MIVVALVVIGHAKIYTNLYGTCYISGNKCIDGSFNWTVIFPLSYNSFIYIVKNADRRNSLMWNLSE